MWVVMNDAFLSIVADRVDHGRLLVRARAPGDLERVFPDPVVEETSSRDYRFRARLPRTAVAQVIAARLEAIAYGNFKASMVDNDRRDVYHDVWQDLRQLQRHG